MALGDIISTTIPIDLDYLAPADTFISTVTTGGAYDPVNTDNLTLTLVDVSGRNSVRRVVAIVSARDIAGA